MTAPEESMRDMSVSMAGTSRTQVQFHMRLPEIPTPRNPSSSILPLPHLLQESSHLDFTAYHILHPRMFQHPPGRSALGAFLFEAVYHISISTMTPGCRWIVATYQNSIKDLKSSLHFTPAAGSSRSFGVGLFTM